eukprot:scaffold30677_cov67-Isochrysis_galbana.AAC.1
MTTSSPTVNVRTRTSAGGARAAMGGCGTPAAGNGCTVPIPFVGPGRSPPAKTGATVTTMKLISCSRNSAESSATPPSTITDVTPVSALSAASAERRHTRGESRPAGPFSFDCLFSSAGPDWTAAQSPPRSTAPAPPLA